MEQTISTTTETVVQLPRTTVQMDKDHALVLDTVGQPPITFHRVFVEVTGGVTSALWLSWAVNQVKKQTALMKQSGVASLDNNEIWFESNHPDCEHDTGLTRREQDTARRLLREAKILHERTAHRGKGFHIDFQVLGGLLHERSAEAWASYASLFSAQGSASATLTSKDMQAGRGTSSQQKVLSTRGAA